MVIDMQEDRLVTLLQLRQFVEGTTEVEFRRFGKDEDRYRHIEGVLRRFGYARLKRTDKGLVVRYLMRTSGYSRPQLVAADQARPGGVAAEGLSRADARLCPPLPRRRRGVAGGHRHAARHALGPGHPTPDATRAGYRLRCPLRPPGNNLDRAFVQSAPAHRLHRTPTGMDQDAPPTQVSIGERRAPAPEGRPGFIHIDTVHQGDQDGVKGVYHINAVDCLTQ